MSWLQSIASVLASLMMLAAFFLLWWKSRSPWLLVAMVAEGFSLVLHALFVLMPTVVRDFGFIFAVWGLLGFVMALCLLAYAVTESTRQP